MDPLSAIGAALSSIKGATEIAKIVRDSISNLEHAELKLRLAELTSLLADAKIDLANIQDILNEKDLRIKELKGIIDLINDEVFWEKPFYYRLRNGENDGPYCQRCWDVDKKLVRVQYTGVAFYKCAQCKNEFDAKPDCELSPSSRRKFLA